MVSDLRLGLFDLPEFGERLIPPERPKRNRTGPGWRSRVGGLKGGRTGTAIVMPGGRTARLARFVRVVRRAAEVVVKVTGASRDAKSLKGHLRYLSRHGANAELEDQDGFSFIGDAAERARLVREWRVSNAEEELGEGRRMPVAALHIVLSMPKGVDGNVVLDAARGFAEEELSNHRYVLVLHRDQEHPHVHVVVNNVGYDLRPLKRDREDLQRWRETFAQELRHRGVEAEATPRRARGVLQRDLHRGVAWSAYQAKKRRDFRAARVYWSQVERAENAHRGLGGEPHIAERRAKETRRIAEEVMRDALANLRAQGAAGSDIAVDVAKFIETMPTPQTQHELYQELIRDGGYDRVAEEFFRRAKLPIRELRSDEQTQNVER